MSLGIQFRASVCGRYVVSIIGEVIRVITVAEAGGLISVYIANRNAFAAAGETAMVRYEDQMIDALKRVLVICQHNAAHAA